MAQPVLNPVDLPADLFPAEAQFARCLARGIPCTVGNGELPEEKIESGENANVVRGEVVRFFAYGGEPDKHPIRGEVIDLQGAWIPKEPSLSLTHANISRALLFHNCHFACSVEMLHAECVALYLDGSRLAQGLNADGLTTKGSVNLRDGFSAEGEVCLSGANIGGVLDCAGGKFHNPNGDALTADGMTTKGGVNLRNGFFAEGEVRLPGANVSGNLSCEDGRFHNPKGNALNAYGITAKGDVVLCDGFSAEGEVRLLGANVGGSLACEGGRFHNPQGSALNAEEMITGSGVSLSDGFIAEGEVRLLGANVGGGLSCANGKFHNPNGNALMADRMTTKGDVSMRGVTANGRVWLLNADVGGNLDCSGGVFINVEGDSLYADSIRTKGSVDFRMAVAVGGVGLIGAQIGWDLICVGVYFDDGFNGESANIGNMFGWHEVFGKGEVVLSRARTSGLSIGMKSPGMFQFALRDFVYGQFFDNESLQSRINWLGNWPKHEYPFFPQPYEQAAKALFGMGQAKDAREILLEKERLQTKDERTPWHHKIGRRLWDVFAGYGYRLRYTAAWMAGFVLVGAFLFNFADDNGRMVPHQPVVLANAEYREATNSPCAEFKCPPEKRPTELVKRLFPDYPEFNALVYSADVFIPFFALHQEPYWYPKPREMDGWFFRWFMPFWYWLEIGAGWVLTSLFLLSITGLLRPRQSSGEKG